jgi:hypothetical protein
MSKKPNTGTACSLPEGKKKGYNMLVHPYELWHELWQRKRLVEACEGIGGEAQEAQRSSRDCRTVRLGLWQRKQLMEACGDTGSKAQAAQCSFRDGWPVGLGDEQVHTIVCIPNCLIWVRSVLPADFALGSAPFY